MLAKRAEGDLILDREHLQMVKCKNPAEFAGKPEKTS